MEDSDDIPLYKMPGPLFVMIMIGMTSFGLFIGGFYWKKYVFPTFNGPWDVSAPGKYLVMIAFLLFSIVAFGISTPLCRYKKVLTLSTFSGLILFAMGSFIFFR